MQARHFAPGFQASAETRAGVTAGSSSVWLVTSPLGNNKDR